MKILTMKIDNLWYCLIFFLVQNATIAQNIIRPLADGGLPQSFVSGIVQDEVGFVWISTRNGLAKYDGNEFQIFKHKVDDPESLASNIITYITKGHGTALWIQYETGEIDVIDVITEKVNHIITSEFIVKNGLGLHMRGWLMTSENIFWCLSKEEEIYSFDFSDKSNIKRKKLAFPGKVYRSLLEDKNKNVWLLSLNEITKIDYHTGRATHFSIPFEQDFDHISGSWDDILYMHERDNGELMWTDKKNFFFLNPKNNSFRKAMLPQTLKNTLKFIYTGPDKREYFVANKTLYSYDDSNGIMEKAAIPNRTIQALLVDRSGLIWIGADTNGFYTIDLTTNFSSFWYESDFAADLLKKEFQIPVYEFFNLDAENKDPLSPAYYLRSVEAENKLWMALNRTVCYYDYQLKRVKKLPNLPDNKHKKDDFVPIKGLAITDKGNPLVIDEESGMFVYDETKSQWEPFPATEILENAFQHRIVPNAIFADRHEIWITTESDGLIYIDTYKKKLVHINQGKKPFKFPTNSLLGITPDRLNQEILWIASYQGLIRFDKKTFASRLFSIEEGLPDNVIYSILTDRIGNLWLGTNKGLCRFNTQTFDTRTFTTSHGLPNYEFNRFHQLPLPDGKMAFGGILGGVVFDPTLIYEDRFCPNTAITGIKINNAAIKSKDRNFLPFNMINNLSLPHDENTLAVEYSALQFSYPKDIAYRYRLKGYDENWIYVGNKREAVYTKIPPGNYTLEINATNTTGEWSDSIRTVTIKISPPWWQTWWAIILYLLIIASGIAFYIRFKIGQEVFKNKMTLKKKEAKHLRKIDKMKSRFFSNITHELRTPLSLILGPAELLKKIKDEKEQGRLLSIIIKNAESLLNLTNQLLDIAKLEAGALKPHMVVGDIVEVVTKIVDVFSEEALYKEVRVIFEAPPQAEYFFSPDTLERIIYNLVSNALKFSHYGGEIKIILEETSGGIMIEVRDNGKGISKEELPNVFKRFYKGKEEFREGQTSGTGIGLSLVQELVDLHRGNITVSSSTDGPTGTTFNVFLPFQKANRAVREEQQEDSTVAAEMALKQNNDKATILLVEDNHELADFISDSLKFLYDIIRAANGNEGMAMALELMPDLVVSDVLMEGMNGFELCKKLKENINTNHIPTILLTAKADMDSRLEGLSSGADDYITKPFNVSELLLRIENKLELQKRQREHLYKTLNLIPHNAQEIAVANQDKFLEKIYQVLDEQMDNENFNVEELAMTLNMSRTSLHRKIKALTNMATGEIIKVYRLKKAILLLHEDFNISEVAYKTGFGSPSYFAKCFKETYHLTPTEYLQKNNLKQ